MTNNQMIVYEIGTKCYADISRVPETIKKQNTLIFTGGNMKRNLKLKKWTAALLAASTVISMSGCGQSSAETGSQTQKTENGQSNEENHSSEQADSQTAPIEVTIATVDAHSGANNHRRICRRNKE